MRDISKYQGIIPAFYACYDEKGEVDEGRVEQLTDYMVKKGVKGVYVGGSSGECIYQSVTHARARCADSQWEIDSHCTCGLQ